MQAMGALDEPQTKTKQAVSDESRYAKRQEIGLGTYGLGPCGLEPYGLGPDGLGDPMG